MSATAGGVLRVEHELLGARFADLGADREAVACYAGEQSLGEGGTDALLADMTGGTYLLLSGRGAATLVETALAGARLAVGEAACEAVLTGEGGLVSVPLALRTGDDETVLLDMSPRGPVLRGWLDFLCAATTRQDPAGFGAHLDDASGLLVCLLLAGPAAADVLADYVPDPSELPAPGSVRQVTLDAIGCLVARPDLPGDAAYLVFVPPAAARRLWRSLLSFPRVAPVGHAALRARLAALPWGPALAEGDLVRPDADLLAAQGLLRRGDDFVGSRALAAAGARPDERSER